MSVCCIYLLKENEMGGIFSVVGLSFGDVGLWKVLVTNQNGRDHLINLNIDGQAVLKGLLKA
jgi:hypothetical protein